ncbi:ArsR/SmtB family transcription factor [Paenibacillus tuaregi]|uniref:ArsR/SmtB family transcription factor n=1 Tax=Paenibacillus tuaregi TaxID=1816681 RepID=UPI0008381731|nr:winged helix-turn-helix domain-containing protein [Paenibacillus tuaregi]
MAFRLDVQFEPVHELINSLHAYICRSSYKKTDLSSAWAEAARMKLTPEFATALSEMAIDADWKLTFLLVHLCPDKSDVRGFLKWLESLSPGDMYEKIAEYSSYFPDNMSSFRARTLRVFEEWNHAYFSSINPDILISLQEEKRRRLEQLPSLSTEQFVDTTTNGLVFKPIQGLEEVILIPQYHFQPINVINYYGRLTLCCYSARVYFPENKDVMNPQNYRMLRSIGEKSRLKILRYLHQGPRSFIEIVRHMKLSKGITHDHISNLRRAGLIYAHFEGETLTEYSLRPGALEEIQKNLLEYISGE